MDGDISTIKKWVVFYPIYINSKKTIAEGRRMSVSKACENPTCEEISDCCRYLHLPSAIEKDKAYPRDFMQRGRVRVLLKKEDGALHNPSIGSRKQLMLQVAEVQNWCPDTQGGRRSKKLHQLRLQDLPSQEEGLPKQQAERVARKRDSFQTYFSLLQKNSFCWCLPLLWVGVDI